MPRRTRPELFTQIEEMLRKVSAQSVLISDLVAGLVGLNSTDLECLDLLLLSGPTTAGRLAAHTGLTSGATTAAIDRLERAGFVTRRRDEMDRRRVLVEIVRSTVDRIAPLYAPLQARVKQVNRRFGDDELATVVEYMTRALEAGAQHVAWLQTQPPVTGSRVSRAARAAASGRRHRDVPAGV